MRAIAATERWATLAGRATWQCSPTGFAHTSVLSGTQAIAAVGRLADADDAPSVRAEIDAVLRDVALTEGYDATAVFGLATAALAVEDLGAVDAIALFSGDDTVSAAIDDTWPYVTGDGFPPPVVVTGDGLVVPATGCALAPGWTVVLAEAGPPLRPDEVDAVVAQPRRRPAVPARRTVLAVLIG